MKKLLFLLFPIFSYGQAVITESGLAGNFNTAGVSGFIRTKTAGELYILFVGISNAGGTPATASISGSSETWTELGSAGGALNSTSGKRVQAFRFYATSTLTSNVTNISYTGSQDGTWVMLYVITNVVVTGSNGADAIVQVVTATDNATIQPTITMSGLLNRASVLTGWINDVNPPTGTPESGWSETEDNGFAIPDTGGYIMTRENTADNTPSWSAGSLSNWAGMAIEFRALGRRTVIIN